MKGRSYYLTEKQRSLIIEALDMLSLDYGSSVSDDQPREHPEQAEITKLEEKLSP